MSAELIVLLWSVGRPAHRPWVASPTLLATGWGYEPVHVSSLLMISPTAILGFLIQHLISKKARTEPGHPLEAGLGDATLLLSHTVCQSRSQVSPY